MKMVEPAHPPLSTTAFNAHKTLVLNSDLSPLEYPLYKLSAEDTVKDMFLERFFVVEWSDVYAHSIDFEMRLPSVVALRKYASQKNLYGVPACNIYNLFVRDGGLCQYSEEPRHLRLNSPNPLVQATIDHVIPKAQKGLLEWNNVVLASQEINNLKGNQTPEQFGIYPKTLPWEPRGIDLLYLWLTQEGLDTMPEAWQEYLQLRPSSKVKRVLDQLAIAA